jgi:hypothetical protein
MVRIRVSILVLLVNQAVWGQPAVAPRALTAVVAAPAAPTITILTAANGAMLRSQGASNAALELGRVSYFRGTSAPGQSSRKSSRSLMISTRFALKVDCPGSPASSKVSLSMSRLDAAATHAISVDGALVGSVPQTLVQVMPCGSAGEHRLDVEIPVSTPAGSIGTAVTFVATINR